jgi:hypothetical protein
LPEPVATDEEVQTFVRSLVENGQIELPAAKKSNGSAKRALTGRNAKAANGNGAPATNRATHTVATIKGTKVLRRIRFH